VFHILDPQEKSFAFKGNIRFRDLETGEKLPSYPEHLRFDYQKEFANFLKTLEDGCREQRIDYALFDTHEPFDSALFQYLNKRARIR
jgi:hypothetical protein